MIKNHITADEQIDILDRSHKESSIDCYGGGGGKGGSTYTPAPIIPTPAVEEASVEVEDDSSKKKTATSKSSLKIPLSTTADTGLNI